MEFRNLSIDELIAKPEFPALADEYAWESGNRDLGEHDIDFDHYRPLEEAGLLVIIGAFCGEVLVGFATLLLDVHHHYSKVVAVVDTVFLTGSKRKGPAGLRLIRKVFEAARAAGAEGAYLSAPAGSRLERLLSLRLEKTDSVFWKKL